MVSHGATILFEKDAHAPAQELAGRTWELCEFIFHGLGVERWPGRFDGRVALHRSCHSRGTRYGTAARGLLESIDGLSLVEFGEPEQCCGFGGTFSVAFPSISRAMGDLKLDAVLATNPDVLVSSDMGCLMHLDGLARRQGRPMRALHVAQVLRDALRGGASRGAP
jgi:L-lactate dehydrogenase complex protein LldE